MILAPSSRAIFAAIAVVSALCAFPAAAQQIVFNNTAHSLNYTIKEVNEFGSELTLGGTARTITEIAFEYFGDFTQQGDELCRVRLYSNETPYDFYRNSPTRLLYESGAFPINPGYNTVRLSGLSIPARDVVTFTVETRGLAHDEGLGLLLYNPPTVGIAYNELWRRTAEGGWQAMFYSFPTPEIRAKIAVRLTAIKTVQLTAARAAQGKIEFGANGMNGSDLVIECSKDLKTWAPVATNSVTSSYMVCQQDLGSSGNQCFYRVRLEK